MHHAARAQRYFRESAVCAAILAATLLAPTGAAAGEPGADVATAFSRGAGGSGTLRLDFEARGTTAILTGASTIGEVEPLVLVCALCTREELGVASRALGARLAAVRAKERPCDLEVVGAPAGSAYRIDGLPGGDPARPRPIEPGRHELRVVGPDGARVASLELAPGEARRVEWDELKDEHPAPRPIRVALSSGGIGLALAAAGTSLLLLDGDCATTRRNTAGECATVHDLAPIGWSLVSAGAAAAVFGVVYGVAEGRVGRRRARSAGGAP